MSALIEELKKEHTEIIDTLKECRELGFFTKKGQTKLISIKANLLEHFKEEEEKFYPALRKAAVQNTKLKKELDVFAKDWGNVSGIAFEIFDSYEKGFSGDRFLLDFGILFSVLRNRMRYEENILYGEYDKLAGM
ncbi:hypothetical protein SCALIN_C05_0009 [Candidatus Scalindua japonica]|uniref:Hemerythrin-like domain-containing protein n=1 Tax=Candidatus Scalindua japonica TaxID=1284222 RepID=A0A286TVR0_9BACT|nr:hemerythrin domain-containing protein [Candidatus Scalindua japonica]GAX59924.1 hypothetical protein SCALIN_C05_0009 [Candidatus Scalindua japonica]